MLHLIATKNKLTLTTNADKLGLYSDINEQFFLHTFPFLFNQAVAAN